MRCGLRLSSVHTRYSGGRHGRAGETARNQRRRETASLRRPSPCFLGERRDAGVHKRKFLPRTLGECLGPAQVFLGFFPKIKPVFCKSVDVKKKSVP